GSRCLLLPSHNPKRRLAYTLEAVRVGKRWVGTHPARANTIGLEAIMAGLVSAVPQIASARAEVAYGTSSRADWVLQTRHGDVWTVEIKSVSLAEDQVALFPDAVTERGRKHLDELCRVVKKGGNALMLFVATRDDVKLFRPALSIDPAYARRLAQAAHEGVLVRAVTSRVTRTQMVPLREIPVDLEGAAATASPSKTRL
ncbi:MAG TPA: DNA/RNA nuclease SfsA, partial [Polyangiaceae bacterium]|nr:DNA/RNA nuclease SfsA [Polyangiaceae bacterium]